MAQTRRASPHTLLAVAGGLTDTSAVTMPETPAAERAAWTLAMLSTIHKQGIDAVAAASLTTRIAQRQPGDDLEHVKTLWEKAASRLGPGRVVEVDAPSPFEIALLVETSPTRRVWLHITVEKDPPHKLDGWLTVRALPAGMAIREVQPTDAAALARL